MMALRKLLKTYYTADLRQSVFRVILYAFTVFVFACPWGLHGRGPTLNNPDRLEVRRLKPSSYRGEAYGRA